MTVTHVITVGSRRKKIEHGLKEENGFVENLKCKNHKLLIGPIEKSIYSLSTEIFKKRNKSVSRLCFWKVGGLTR